MGFVGRDSRVYLAAPSRSAHTESWAPKRAYLPKYDNSYFMSTLQESEGGDNFLPGRKNTWKFQIPWTFPGHNVSDC